MALLEMAAECEIYFTTNWTDTDIKLPDTPFDYTGEEEKNCALWNEFNILLS